MRRIVIASCLFVSACATAPTPEAPPVAPITPVQRDPAGLVGLSASQLLSKLGSPALQIREGSGLKLQFRNSRCVIDAYLYPQGRGGPDKVEYVDTRAPSGVRANEEVCVALFQSKAN